jgi:hypothetical protein
MSVPGFAPNPRQVSSSLASYSAFLAAISSFEGPNGLESKGVSKQPDNVSDSATIPKIRMNFFALAPNDILRNHGAKASGLFADG